MSVKPAGKGSVRCAVYTRVSTDAGLDQDFNSLDAQYEGASAYIRSQAHAGWTMLRKRYDDGGFSGGSTDRPALQQLLNDVRLGRIDIIVVYKVDRLTRSLADFAKLVELFDEHQVSFVSVTQHFNTTTSMGRLTLNVLLSFAQFEREVTSERIRDKIAASKRRGLWVGGVVPLGYHAKDRKITLVESEAKTVRHIFKRYLELGSLGLLLADLKQAGITTRVRPLANGRTAGGIPFTRGPLAYLLRNRFYVGEIKYKGEILAGEQPKLLDRALFDAVQLKLDQQRSHLIASRQSSGALLMGLIYDSAGRLMTPTHALRRGKRYGYYVSSVMLHGEPLKAAINRVACDQIERLTIEALRKMLGDFVPSEIDTRQLIRDHLRRVDVHADHLVLTAIVRADRKLARADWHTRSGTSAENKTIAIRVPWTKRPSKIPREIIPSAESTSRRDHRPIRAETRAKLVTAIAQGRRWLDELLTGRKTSAQEIADREKCSVRQVNMSISLAFLSPALVSAAIEGRLPRGIGVASLRDAPPEWSSQYARFGLSL